MQHGRIDLNIENALSPAIQFCGCRREAARCLVVPSHREVNAKLTISPPAFTYVKFIPSQTTL